MYNTASLRLSPCPKGMLDAEEDGNKALRKAQIFVRFFGTLMRAGRICPCTDRIFERCTIAIPIPASFRDTGLLHESLQPSSINKR